MDFLHQLDKLISPGSAALGVAITSVIGLLAWLTKHHERRTDRITAKYMEKQEEFTGKIIEIQHATIQGIAQSTHVALAGVDVADKSHKVLLETNALLEKQNFLISRVVENQDAMRRAQKANMDEYRSEAKETGGRIEKACRYGRRKSSIS